MLSLLKHHHTSKSLIIVLFLLLGWFAPRPADLSIEAWHLFSIFLATILAVVVKAQPIGVIAISVITFSTLTNTITIEEALHKFGSPTVWLILIAFLLARGFIKSGLGSRIAYAFVYLFGRHSLGLGYSLVLTEFVLAPFIPSNTARGGGILFPLASSISDQYDSHPSKGTERKIGAFLLLVCFHANIITSAMFLTAMAANPIIVSFAENIGVHMTWLMWCKAAIVPGCLSLIIMPIYLYFFYPPEIRSTPDAKAFAQNKLKSMGPMSRDENVMISVFTLLLTLWVFGSQLQIDATTAAFLGLSILLLTGVLRWEDVVSETNAWTTFVWLTTLLMLTHQLADLEFVAWFVSKVKIQMVGYSWQIAVLGSALIYFYSHYFFAGKTSRVSALYGALIVAVASTSAPVSLVAYLFAFISSLSACLTHYSTAIAPIYFGAGYVSSGRWWGLGFGFSLVQIIIWAGIGLPWWHYLGLW